MSSLERKHLWWDTKIDKLTKYLIEEDAFDPEGLSPCLRSQTAVSPSTPSAGMSHRHLTWVSPGWLCLWLQMRFSQTHQLGPVGPITGPLSWVRVAVQDLVGLMDQPCADETSLMMLVVSRGNRAAACQRALIWVRKAFSRNPKQEEKAECAPS